MINIQAAFHAAQVVVADQATAPDVVDVDREEPMLYLWQVVQILDETQKRLEGRNNEKLK